MNITKRNGILEPYNQVKIENALIKAFRASGYDEAFNCVITDVLNHISVYDEISVEEIQDQIIEILRDFCYDDIADNFNAYRAKRQSLRELAGNRSDFIDKCAYSNENTATLSEVDANANVQNKNVCTIETEVFKDKNKEIQRYRMNKYLKHMYPEVADQYEKDLKHHIIYTHDEASSSVPKPYCVAVSMYPFFKEGTSNLDGLHLKAPQNLDSFCGQFNNLVFLLSSQFKGAIAFGEFFNAIYYYCTKEWGEDFWKHDQDIVNPLSLKKKTISETIEQVFQGIVCSINQPAGNRSFQSPSKIY